MNAMGKSEAEGIGRRDIRVELAGNVMSPCTPIGIIISFNRHGQCVDEWDQCEQDCERAGRGGGEQARDGEAKVSYSVMLYTSLVLAPWFRLSVHPLSVLHVRGRRCDLIC